MPRQNSLRRVEIVQIAGNDFAELLDLYPIGGILDHQPQLVGLVGMLGEVGANIARGARYQHIALSGVRRVPTGRQM